MFGLNYQWNQFTVRKKTPKEPDAYVDYKIYFY